VELILGRISGSHGGEHEYDSLLGTAGGLTRLHGAISHKAATSITGRVFGQLTCAYPEVTVKPLTYLV
jgi:hypothetical protein